MWLGNSAGKSSAGHTTFYSYHQRTKEYFYVIYTNNNSIEKYHKPKAAKRFADTPLPSIFSILAKRARFQGCFRRAS
jgi:hypothetical protein